MRQIGGKEVGRVQQGANTLVMMRLRVELLGIKPAPWRRIEVTTATTLAGLHEVIQAAMGWEDLHLHCFRILGRRYDGEYADLTRVVRRAHLDRLCRERGQPGRLHAVLEEAVDALDPGRRALGPAGPNTRAQR